MTGAILQSLVLVLMISALLTLFWLWTTRADASRRFRVSIGPDRLELRRTGSAIPLLTAGNVVFDRRLDRVLDGAREVCSLESVVAVGVYSPTQSDESERGWSGNVLYLVFLDKDKRERRHDLDQGGSREHYVAIRDAVGKYVQAEELTGVPWGTTGGSDE